MRSTASSVQRSHFAFFFSYFPWFGLACQSLGCELHIYMHAKHCSPVMLFRLPGTFHSALIWSLTLLLPQKYVSYWYWVFFLVKLKNRSKMRIWGTMSLLRNSHIKKSLCLGNKGSPLLPSALSYQTSTETGAHSSVKITLRRSPREIHETCMSWLLQHTNEQVLINMTTENNPLLNKMPPFMV